MAKKRKRNSQNEKPDKHPHDAPGALGSLLERHVPELLARRVKPAGFRCKTCGWDADKPGYRGQQGMRAHMRVHVRTRRALKRGSLLAGFVLAVTVIVLYRSGDRDWLLS